ncbi:methionine adenosyltransferase [Ponticaulis sp.]|uniref:methionine adenosyltransferase n=1 Tax=Ponticaulis sp. TaxID=2020902 RepID=UPI000B6B5E66|nr:methionine adenosyltransferase [Ponticaulis sp.]MAJ09466.1 methionine adenosyltransferase [Ponticaulis sp.]RPG18814.1 MAG: methionine adenosyltransferase [Hyphomonadaceae bacterium TMED125]HBH89783.1 methionine adenosyltransferase [Hyphomonadaceae bacterium]
MIRKSYNFTSESVSEGHPDKVCDRISDSIVDLFIGRFPEARVACETLTTTNLIVLAGEMRMPEDLMPSLEEMEHTVRQAVKDIGYHQKGFHWRTAELINRLHGQSNDIAMGVDEGTDKEEGAGDQGIMFGYATNETPELMPAPIIYSHQILKRMAELRKSGEQPEFEPDAKSQVTLRYEDGRPVGVESVVVSTQHKYGFTPDDIRELVRPIVTEVLPEGWFPPEEEFYVNPTGNFVIGGPDGDAGLTGRKIIVDTYGGAAPHGGGAFSGKDPTKVDRSAAYACRYLAKNVVAAGLADRCTIQVSYAIGVAKPLSVYVNCDGTEKVEPEKIENALRDLMDLSPKGIRTHLQLNRPIYARTAAYGHFGRTPEADGGFSWEKTDIADQLKGLL